MSLQARNFVVLFLVLLFTGCTLDFAIPEHLTMRLSVYEHGQQVHSRQADSTDPAVKTINDWLNSNREGWDYGFVTRSSGIVVEGQSFSINILQNEVSVKYCRRKFYNCHFWIKKSTELFSELKTSEYLRIAPTQ